MDVVNVECLKAGINDDGRRIDRILRRCRTDLPVSVIYRLLRQGRILIDGKRAALGCRVQNGQFIEIHGVDAAPIEAARSLEASVPSGKISVLYEGCGILAVDKPCGMRVQEELGAAACSYLKGKTASSLSFTPGPLHRLDCWSSGVIVFGSSLVGAQRFSALMRASLLRKIYIALLEGCLRSEQLWRDVLRYSSLSRKTRVSGLGDKADDGKVALSHAAPLAVRGGLTLAKIEIETGRTHQIRAQAAARGYPLYGDRKYGSKNPSPFFLHAYRIDFPVDSPFPPSISAAVPSAFTRKLAALGFDTRVLRSQGLVTVEC
jgi:23S rRNA pseudouridine955/2504/2580 synthase